MENPFKKDLYRNLPNSSIETVYENDTFNLPFDPKDLVMFLDRDAEETSENLSRRMRTIPYHHRSADIGIIYPMRQTFPGAEHVYTQIDIKGGGFVFPETHESKKHGLKEGELAGSPEAVFVPHSYETPMGYDFLGLLDEGMITTTVNRSKELASYGMRTEAVAGVYHIKTIRIAGEDVPVSRFKKQALDQLKALVAEAEAIGDEEETLVLEKKIRSLRSREGFRPVVEVRLMRSVYRLRDLKDANPIQQKAMLEEVEKSLNIEMQALGLEKRFDLKSREGRTEWLKFVTYWLGKNTGIMHSLGLVHIFLHMGNITMAGEVVDLDSVQPVVKTNLDVKEEDGETEEDFMGGEFFHETATGWACVNPGVGEHRRPDFRWGLPKCIVKDLRDASFSLRMVLKETWPAINGEPSAELRRQLADEFIRGYTESMGTSEPYAAIGVTKDRILAALNVISDTIIVRGKRIAPIPTDDAPDQSF